MRKTQLSRSSVGSVRQRRPEDAIQRAVFQHLRVRGAHGHIAFAVPNGGARSKPEAAVMVGLGVLAGIPDVLILHDGKVYALELKSENGSLTPAQKAVQVRLRRAGISVATAYGLDQAITILEAWGLLTGRVAVTRAQFGQAGRQMQRLA